MWTYHIDALISLAVQFVCDQRRIVALLSFSHGQFHLFSSNVVVVAFEQQINYVFLLNVQFNSTMERSFGEWDERKMFFIPNAKCNRICRLKEILNINKADFNKITSNSKAIKCMAAAQIGRGADMQNACQANSHRI